MTDVAIKLHGISKKYRIRHQRQRHNVTLRDTIAEKMTKILRPQQDGIEPDTIEDFWALKDVSFEIKHGECVGIIGRNGAGKSTLLKILSRITEPTEGRLEIDGRVASLLEVGTGFHPELTGRENIYLNGAVLGMSRVEIKRRFDEIVSFAGIEKFLDTPVKRYSSGMYVRLAFSVAAHLETDTLLVDEVLAVGDQEFQNKCLDKMQDVASHQGRTVLLVSHNLSAISEMAPRTLLFESGNVALDGTTSDVISNYLSKGQSEAAYVRPADRPTRSPHVNRAQVFTSDANGVHRFGEPLEIKFWIRHEQPLSKGYFGYQLINQFQQPVIHVFANYPKIRFGSNRGETVLVCRIPTLRVNVGKFYIRTFLSELPGGEFYEALDGICPIKVIRIDQSVPWGWRPEVCAYHEQYEWTVIEGHITEPLQLE
jgi:lipopolysaccharide transport system ATP-binding protein